MAERLLDIQDVRIRYSGIEVIHGVSLGVKPGETVCVVGSNGSGKSSLLRAIMGAQRVSGGRIEFMSRGIQGLRTEDIVRLGIIYVPEQRMLFGPLPVEENLRLGAYILNDKIKVRENLQKVYGMFPRLSERRHQAASTLSGGEQQMVAIGRGLMSNPKLLMLDEPSLGLAPLLIDELFGTIRRLKEEGMTILLVEQNVQEALELAAHGYVLQTGRIVLEGPSQDLLASDMVRKAYLGL